MTGRKICALFYGRAKTGKSTLCDSSPGPRLILDAEMGSDFLDSEQIIWDVEGGQEVPKGLEEDTSVVVYVHEYTTLRKVYEILDTGDHEFETVIIDSVTEIQQRCLDDKVGTNQMKLQDWGEIKRQMSLDIRNFRDLKAHPKKAVNVIFVATLEESTSPDGSVRLVPYMQGSVSKELPYVVDLVGLLYIDREDNVTRKLYVGSRSDTDTGDRTGHLPDEISSPDVFDILEMIENGARDARNARKEKRAKKLASK